MSMKKLLKGTRDFVREYRQRTQNAQEVFESSEIRLGMEKYLRFCQNEPIEEKAVLYESYFGRGIDDNPHAIFRYLLADERFEGYKHYWSVETLKDNEAILRYQGLENVYFVERNSEEYLHALATCKYLINSATLPSYFSKREGQIYVNTWHGTPIRKMGYDQVGGITASANTVRNFLHADYLVSGNDTMTKMYLDSYKMKGIYPGLIIEEGNPRTDITLKAVRQEVIDVLARAGISIDSGKKLVMYAPTWREHEGSAVITPDGLLEFKDRLQSQLDTSEYQVLFKPPQRIINATKDMPEYKGMFIPSWVDTNELLSIVDVLVADFSSSIYDYLVLNRPMVFYIPDLEDYGESHDLVLGVDDLPGPYTDKLDEVPSLIEEVLDHPERYEAAQRQMRDKTCPYDDGNVTKRFVDVVFFGGRDYRFADATTSKHLLLISGGELYQNGITRSLISLLKQIDYEKWDVTVFFNWVKPEVKYLLDELDPSARVLIRSGAFFRNRREDALIETLDEIGINNRILRKINQVKVRPVYERECHRCFGNIHFDRAIDFCGYVRQLGSMISVCNTGKSYVWLHNDIYEDMNKFVNGKKKNYKVLGHTVSLFPDFDKVVSCGKSVMEANRTKLSTPETYDKFVFVHNTIDVDRIEKLLDEPVLTIGNAECYYKNAEPDELFSHKLIALPKEGETTFINVGRMSTEKNQETLIRAFARVHAQHPQTSLFILGEGPLRQGIEDTIDELGLQESVHLTGNVNNPFQFLKRSSCFILPSTHEGQPLVVLEARSCGLPVVVGNFSTVEDILMENGQLVIDTDENGIYEGMLAFIRGDVPKTNFSMSDYNKKVYEEFERVIA